MNISNMTLEQKVGQLFALTSKGTTVSPETRQLVAEKKLGGVFLNIDSLQDPEQVKRLTDDLQREALTNGAGIPLFISADFVAGAGCKLKGGAVHFPKNRAIGAAGDERLAYESGRVTAEESLAMGVNFNYSPVTDINNNPDNPVIGTHSFGDDPESVSLLANAVIRGYQDHGLIATAKHFPGHGDTNIDSHYDLPVLTFDRERLEKFELEPFRRAIAAGVEAIMIGHISVPALDSTGMPASLSYEMTTRLLREELGFQGLIVTDGLSMKGITNRYSMEEACVRALQAGADILLGTARSHEEALSMVETVMAAVAGGDISEARIDESVARILAVKEKYGLTRERFAEASLSADGLSRLDAEPSRRVSREIAELALAPLHGMTALPADGQTWTLIRDVKAEMFASRLKDQLGGRLAGEVTIPSYLELGEALDRIGGGSRIIVAVCHNKPIDQAYLAQMNERLRQRGSSGVRWVHFGSNYDADHLPGVPVLLAYDHAPSLQEAAVSRLLGT
jgi:beta-N-acetylhexosaminidase